MAFCDYKHDKKFSSVRRHVLFKRVRSVVLFLAFLTACLLFGRWWGGSSRYANETTGMVFCGIIGLCGIKLFGVQKLFTDKYIEGEITEISEKAVDETNSAHTQMIKFGKQITQMDMYILMPDGNVKMHTMKFDGIPPDYYKVGDRVRHYPGLVLFEKEDKSKDNKIICSICGNYLSIDEDNCPFCRYSLLK